LGALAPGVGCTGRVDPAEVEPEVVVSVDPLPVGVVDGFDVDMSTSFWVGAGAGFETGIVASTALFDDTTALLVDVVVLLVVGRADRKVRARRAELDVSSTALVVGPCARATSVSVSRLTDGGSGGGEGDASSSVGKDGSCTGAPIETSLGRTAERLSSDARVARDLSTTAASAAVGSAKTAVSPPLHAATARDATHEPAIDFQWMFI